MEYAPAYATTDALNVDPTYTSINGSSSVAPIPIATDGVALIVTVPSELDTLPDVNL